MNATQLKLSSFYIKKKHFMDIEMYTNKGEKNINFYFDFILTNI